MDLTDTEKKVYGKLSLGLSNQEVADSLGKSIRVIKFHITNVYRKMEVKTRSQFIVKAVISGKFPEGLISGYKENY